MKPEFTVDGITVQTFDEILTALVNEYKAIYGADIDLSQNTPDGQKVGIEAALEYDLQSFGAALYNQFDPDFSSGEMLNKIIKLIGINRGPATRSSAEVTITTNANMLLESGYTIADNSNQNWLTTEDASLVAGANTITVYAELWGKIEAPVGTIISPVTIVPGVLSVTNPADAIPGVDEETDSELRIRRNKSLENASYSTIGGLYAKLANIEGVTDLKVYENDTDVYDATLDLNAHTIWVVIANGAVSDIAEIIAKNKTGGTGLKGVQSATFVESLIKPNGLPFTYIHTVLYDRPVDVPIYITMTATRKDPAVAVDTALIKEKLATKLYQINENAQANELYGYAYQAGTNFIATDLLISNDNITYVDSQLISGFDEILSISIVNITINEVI